MANENVPAPAPTRSDDQILPFAAWVPIGKSNFVLDLQKKQRNPIFQIYVDILQNINFFRAFTASASLDEEWFILDANLLREALEITPVDQAHQFVSPPSGDAIMDFVNQLGYPGEIHFVSRMAGIITRTNVDYAELVWKEFVQAIQTFLTDKVNLGIPTKKGKNTKPHVIHYSRFTKLIIYYLRRIHNIHQRSRSPLNLAKDDLSLGNLKFVPKGKTDEVFGMQIPKELIMDNIRNAPYYNAYLEMSKKPTIAEQPKLVPSKQSKPVPAMKPKVTQEKPLEPSHAKHPKRGKMSLETFQAHGQAPVGGVAIREQVEEATRQLPVVEGKGKAIATDEQDAASANIVHDTPYPADAETRADTNITTKEKTVELDKGQARSDPGKTLESGPLPKHEHMDEDQAGPNPGQKPVIAATTEATTTTLPLPPPPPLQQQSATNSSLASRVSTLEQRSPLRDRFRELPEADMKEILHQQMFESGSYKSLPEHVALYEALNSSSSSTPGTYQSQPEHVALYEALEASMNRNNRDEFLESTAKSRSKQPPAPQSSAWKTSDTRKSPSSSSKQKSVPLSKQLVKEVPIPDDANISDSEDTDIAHLPKIKTRPNWLKPVLEEDRQETTELD
ncbi:hypothetical protein Tco_1371988 [Tanacetum coccineum]